MVAPTNQPVVSSVPLFPIMALLGEVSNQYQPTNLTSYNVIIPNPLLGNEPIAGFAAFTLDGVTANMGESGSSLTNFLGFFENQYFNEWDPGSLIGADTLGNNFKTTVCSSGTIFVYNCVAVTPAKTNPIYVITSITTGTTPAAILVGSLWQGGGSLPAGSTGVQISAVATVRTPQTVVGGGCWVTILNPL